MKKPQFSALVLVTALFSSFLLGFFLGRQTGTAKVRVSTVVTEQPVSEPSAETRQTQPGFPIDINTATAEELTALPIDERELFKEELGIKQSGLEKLVVAGYDLLGLMSFLTAGQPEVRAWTIKKGTKAPQAAGKIHSDFERGFIRAEVVSFDVLMECGSMQAAKEKGLVRSEGKEYVMQDGDIVLFRFNV